MKAGQRRQRHIDGMDFLVAAVHLEEINLDLHLIPHTRVNSRTGRVAQVVEHLHSRHEVPSSNPSATKTKQKKTE
jgi:hypothetical protein